MSKLTHLDLFSGIGGFSLAAQWAGFETIAFCEKDKFCQKVLFKHWPEVLIYSDIKEMDFSAHVDLLTAGFPCQPFSCAGKKKGKNDDRYLWPEVIRLVRRCKPTWVVLENVPGIISMLDTILEDLEREAYTWQAYFIPASAIGAPHKRERLWIVANTLRQRRTNRTDSVTKRSLQDNEKWNLPALQAEWNKRKFKPWETFKVENWLGFNADATSEQGRGADTQSATESQSIHRRRLSKRAHCANVSISPWQENEPPICGVDDGLPFAMERNKALGNAIVPQVVYPILMIIYEIEKALVIE